MCAFQADLIFPDYFIRPNSLECFEILETLMMTWADKEHCLGINVILIQKMSFRLNSGTSIKQACFIVDTLL